LGLWSFLKKANDRDSIYSSELDSALKSMRLSILKTPFRAPQANTFCERLVGIIRHEPLGFLNALNESHLRRIRKEWVAHDNRGRPHASLVQGIPEPSGILAPQCSGPHISFDLRVVRGPVLGGLHHEYRLEKNTA
jgi:hypothetical protein